MIAIPVPSVIYPSDPALDLELSLVFWSRKASDNFEDIFTSFRASCSIFCWNFRASSDMGCIRSLSGTCSFRNIVALEHKCSSAVVSKLKSEFCIL